MSVRCKQCGCREVQIACWVVANTNEILDDVPDVDAWCPECEDETETEECDDEPDDAPDGGPEQETDAAQDSAAA